MILLTRKVRNQNLSLVLFFLGQFAQVFLDREAFDLL